MFEHSNYREAIFFDGETIGTAAQVSTPIANPKQAAFRVVGWFGEEGATGTGSVAVKVQGADKSDATAWTDIETGTFNSTGTADGEFFNKVVDADFNYIRANVTGSGVTGKMNVAAEYIPR